MKKTILEVNELLKHIQNLEQGIQNLKEENQALRMGNFAVEEKSRSLEKENMELKKLLEYYEEQFRLLQHKKFGASSEKTDSRQLRLFDNDRNEVSSISPQTPLRQIASPRRKKRTNQRKDDFSQLPVETITHSLPDEERICPKCGNFMRVMGREIKWELGIIPAQVKAIEHVRETYSCRYCEKNDVRVPIVKAPAPISVIKGSPASPSLIAYIMSQKYMNAMPLYRQERNFLLSGLRLSRQTMANWLLNVSEDWLEPLYIRMKSQLLKEDVLHADETTLRVLRDPDGSGKHHSYVWLYQTGKEASVPIVLYEYQPSRSRAHPTAFLDKFKGYLHTDGYSSYHKLPPRIVVVGCWAHVRRKFDEAVKGAPPQCRENLFSKTGLELCNELFHLERDFINLSPDERHKVRLERSKPVSDELFLLSENANVLPKSLSGKAVHYLLYQREYLENVFADGRLELSNNRAERSIKTLVIGRKNWLFSNTPGGAKASAIIYSVIETAKGNGLNPFEYLQHLLQKLPSRPDDNALDTMMPWSKTLPDRCRVKTS